VGIVRNYPFCKIISLALLASALTANANDPRIGVMTHFAQGWPTSQADTTAGLGLGNVRDELYWAAIEKAPGVYTFPATFDSYMAKLRQDGIAPLIELDFENPFYDGGQTPYTAAGFAGYANYCAAVLAHYGSQIAAVEIWNEYNGGFCAGPATGSREGTYTAMLKQAYIRIKGIRPDVTVVGGSTASTPIPYWKKLMQDGALAYMDVLSIHPYRYNSPPEGIESEIATLQSMILKYNHGVAKPIWATEIGWEEQTGPLLIDDTTLAKYVTRSYALLFSAGVQRVYWYLLHDDSGEPMGLYQANMTPKPAAQAMRTLISELNGAAFVSKEKTPAEVYSLLFQGSNGRQVRIMWSLASRAVNLGGVSRAVDMLGNPLSPAGSYVLSDAPIFVEGYVSGVPAPSASDEVLLTDSEADFNATRGFKGWTYGYVDGTGAFTPMPTYIADEWKYYWTANFPYVSVTATDMHPSMDGAKTVKAVRRWTSNVNGAVHLVGDFQGGTQGDGVGVEILVNGQPALARQIIGGPNAAAKYFDFVRAVSKGTTVDFVVDAGPGTDMNFDATAFAAKILTKN